MKDGCGMIVKDTDITGAQIHVCAIHKMPGVLPEKDGTCNCADICPTWRTMAALERIADRLPAPMGGAVPDGPDGPIP